MYQDVPRKRGKEARLDHSCSPLFSVCTAAQWDPLQVRAALTYIKALEALWVLSPAAPGSVPYLRSQDLFSSIFILYTSVREECCLLDHWHDGLVYMVVGDGGIMIQRTISDLALKSLLLLASAACVFFPVHLKFLCWPAGFLGIL